MSDDPTRITTGAIGDALRTLGIDPHGVRQATVAVDGTDSVQITRTRRGPDGHVVAGAYGPVTVTTVVPIVRTPEDPDV